MQSLGFRTELALLLRWGSEVEDRGDYLAVRTPDNPTYYWGNFILVSAPPRADAVDEWLGVFRREFPDAAHAALGIDRPSGGRWRRCARPAWRVDQVVAMTAASVHPPPRPHDGGDPHAGGRRRLGAAGGRDARRARTRPTSRATSPRRKTASYRGAGRGGHGRWWGAFVDGLLVASLGIYTAGEGLARFQAVKTGDRPPQPGAGRRTGRRGQPDAAAELGARQLVMVADPSTRRSGSIARSASPRAGHTSRRPRCWSPGPRGRLEPVVSCRPGCWSRPPACWWRGAAARRSHWRTRCHPGPESPPLPPLPPRHPRSPSTPARSA